MAAASKSSPLDPSGAPHALPAFSEIAGSLAAHLADEGDLGLVLIHAPGLSRVEDRHGVQLAQDVHEMLAAEVIETCRGRLDTPDLIARGEAGRYEILIFLPWRVNGGAFYRNELPRLRRDLELRIQERCNRELPAYVGRMLSVCIGEAVMLNESRLGAESQMRRAMKEARRDAELNRRIEARLRRKDLVTLLLEGAVRSVYEPIVEVKSRTVFGYEALARGPAGTPLHSPLAMFDAASDEELVYELDCLCRRQGVAGAIDLPEDTKLFLNVRPTAMYDPSFRGDGLRRTLEGSHLQPSDIVFEISEQESIQDFDRFRKVRDYFGKLGVQFALDDTGAGYASLQAVIELCPEFIKVDRTFVHGIDEDPACQELLRALDSVASRIGARIIAEGLDTLEELETLEGLGIPFGQGWLFGKPTPLSSSKS